MTPLSLQQVTDEIKVHEGFRAHPYRCTGNKLTIGYGRNIEDVGLSQEEAEILLKNDIMSATQEAKNFVSSEAWAAMGEARQTVVVNMTFNLGMPTLRKFKKFRAALEAGDYQNAALEMADSAWFRQVGNRAVQLRDRMLKGTW